ncbi:endo-1,4-beta xylanase [Amylostereum chailletii]|nr:endo-1,4-beta xylanase [Amylostereum chailletii]
MFKFLFALVVLYSQCLLSTSAAPGAATAPALNQSAHVLVSTVSAASGLNSIAKGAGKLYFGSATDNSELSDSAYVKILSDSSMFGQLTPGNSMKWDATEPSRGTFTFTKGDQIASLAKKNGQLLRGHNCVWHNQLPSWVSNGGFDAATLTSIIQTHCSTLVGHYKGQICTSYSLTSPLYCMIPGTLLMTQTLIRAEPFNDDGTWRKDVFFNTLNTDYVAIALKAARAADSKAKLYINDYNVEGSGAKATALLNLVKSLKSKGVPIDGVGLQSHFIVGSVPSTLQANMQAFTALGVEVAITELDIRMTLPSTAAKLAQQKTDYQNVIKACVNVKGCIGVTLWDYTDKYSWVPSTFSGQGAACPWDSNLAKKSAYDGIAAGF